MAFYRCKRRIGLVDWRHPYLDVQYLVAVLGSTCDHKDEDLESAPARSSNDAADAASTLVTAPANTYDEGWWSEYLVVILS